MNKFLKLLSFLFIISLAIMGVSGAVVTGTGLPSASNDLEYKYFTVSFIDHCPLCGANNCLVWNIKGTYEGEWTCKVCGADYCAVTGADKSHNIRAYLIKVETFTFKMPVIWNYSYGTNGGTLL